MQQELHHLLKVIESTPIGFCKGGGMDHRLIPPSLLSGSHCPQGCYPGAVPFLHNLSEASLCAGIQNRRRRLHKPTIVHPKKSGHKLISFTLTLIGSCRCYIIIGLEFFFLVLFKISYGLSFLPLLCWIYEIWLLRLIRPKAKELSLTSRLFLDQVSKDIVNECILEEITIISKGDGYISA